MTTSARTRRGGWASVAPGAVSFRGPDARRWANGLFTNNLRDLPVGRWNRSALLDDRAHVGGFLDVLCLADDAWIAIVDGLSADAFAERLDRHLFFDKVEVAVLPWRRVAVFGEPAGIPRPGPGEVVPFGDGWAWRHRRSPGATVDIVSPSLLGSFGGDELGADVLDRERVEAAIPAFPADTGEKRLPHELGIRDEILHFEKGCYLGQEIVHRVDVQGQVRRALVRVATPGLAAVGAEVRVGPDLVGALTSPVLRADGTGLGLCVIRRPFDVAGTAVRVGDAPGTVL